jgi:hypothetical protein
VNNADFAIKSMREWLNTNLPKDASAHIVKEDDALKIHLNFGKYDDYTLASQAIKTLKKQSNFINDAMDKMRDYSDSAEDFMWFAEWDWDDDITDY